MKPLIGITTSVNSRNYEESNQSVVMLPANYPKAVINAGGIPLLLSESEDVDELLDCLDGLVISGGRDLNPKLYDETPHEKTVDFSDSQDKWEISLIEGAIKRELPLLCICRGHQLLCVIRGGKLFQDLPTTEGYENHGATGGKWSEHVVKLASGSLISELLGDEVIGNSGHHQGVYDAGDMIVVGRTLDGLIEAVEMDGYPFLISTQWHPEMLKQEEIFEGLIQASI
jgi:putative glutamine amidotransferase|tara:strand:+ start:2850 stop:3533 length:684 start_codon:yes stop_codon:yes gene_type:complete